MRITDIIRIILVSTLLSGAALPLGAQTSGDADADERSDPDDASGPPQFLGLDLGFGVSGNATIMGGLYRSRGIDARRPTETWRMSLSPSLELPLGMTAGLNVLLSSEGRDFRQNINQFGISPTWDWGTLHLGDFNRELTELTVSGQRIRGVGLDLSPQRLRFSVQAGRAQRAAVGTGGTSYDRMLIGARLGYGAERSAYIDLNVVRAKDDESSVDETVVLRDTLLLDTIPEGLRPERRAAATPQENLVAGLAGRLPLFHDALVVEAELSGALTTRDLTSPRADAAHAGVPGVIDALHPIRLSTVGDLAYRIDATGRFSNYQLNGGYEYIGPGYASAGMAYIINDRQSYQLGGSAQLARGRVVVQARHRHENNNLLDQRRSTTRRDVSNATVSLRATETVVATLTALRSFVANDAPPDSGGLENRARSLNGTVSFSRPVLDRATTVSIAYGLHLMDGFAAEPIPGTRVHNVSTSAQVQLTPTVNLGPSVSGVLRKTDGRDDEQNLLFGFRGRARLFDGRLRTSANVSHTFSAGREIFGATARVSYPIVTDVTLSLLARHNEYSAFAGRSAFAESFATLTLSTSF